MKISLREERISPSLPKFDLKNLARCRDNIVRDPENEFNLSQYAYYLYMYWLETGRRKDRLWLLDKALEAAKRGNDRSSNPGRTGLLTAILIDAGRMKEALILLEEKIRNDPENITFLKMKIDLLEILKCWKEIRRICRQIIRIDESDAFAYASFAGSCLRTSGFGSVRKAQHYIDRALRLDHQCQKGLFIKAEILIRKKAPLEQIRSLYQKLIFIDPSDENAKKLLAEADQKIALGQKTWNEKKDRKQNLLVFLIVVAVFICGLIGRVITELPQSVKKENTNRSNTVQTGKSNVKPINSLIQKLIPKSP